MIEWTDWRRTRELLTPADMSRADQATIAAGTPGIELMERAGAAVADEAARLALPTSRETPRIAVLCGPGNNGGDGYVAARLLAKRGLQVRLFALGDRTKLKGDAAIVSTLWRWPARPLTAYRPERFSVAVDALFGAGLARDLDGEARDTVERVNGWRRATGGKVVAVDAPSGLDGATGQPRGSAIEADSTVTFFRLKPGHVLMPGRLLCGDLRLAQIGIAADVAPAASALTSLNGPALWRDLLPSPRTLGHKYARGHALVVSGPAHHTGAARLSALAAARIGAGLVTVAGSNAALATHAAHLTAIMLAPCENAAALAQILADVRKNAVVIGPGLGLGEPELRQVEAVLQPSKERGVVLDADALTLLAGQADRLRGLVEAHLGAVVLTPHEGEFSRLAKGLRLEVDSESQPHESPSQVVASKLSRARALARATSATVLLKGPDTIIAAPDGRASIATDLPANLATAGSGDVLAGLIGGLLAQGMPAFEAASAAVWLHGQAAEAAGRGLTAEDLPNHVPDVLKRLAP